MYRPHKSTLLWQVYGLVDPRNGRVRYVGWTTDAEYRLKAHILESEEGTTHKCQWIRSLLENGLVPELKILEQGEGDTWSESERWWIKFYREEVGEVLTNATDGGEGSPGRVISEETRRKMSESKQSAWKDSEYRDLVVSKQNAGRRPWTDERRERVRSKLKDRVFSDETRRKLANSKLGNSNYSSVRVSGRFQSKEK